MSDQNEQYTLSDLGRMDGLPSRQTISGWVQEYERDNGPGSFTDHGCSAPGGRKTYPLEVINRLLAYKGYKPLEPQASVCEVEFVEENPSPFVDLALAPQGRFDISKIPTRAGNIISAPQLNALVETVEAMTDSLANNLRQDQAQKLEHLEMLNRAKKRLAEARAKQQSEVLRHEIVSDLTSFFADSVIEQVVSDKQAFESELAREDGETPNAPK